MHHRISDVPHARFIRAALAGGAVVPVRVLALSVSLSILSFGLIGLASPYFESGRPALSPGDALRAPEGSRVLVRGLLLDVRPVGTGAAVGSISDCAGAAAPVFFEEAPGSSLAWRLVTLDASVSTYRGSPELVVRGAHAAEPVSEPAAVVDPGALAADWRAFLCRPVAVHAPVLWAGEPADGGRRVEIGLFAGGPEVLVVAHADAYLAVTLNPGAEVTFIGVVASAEDGKSPVLHVRV